MTQADLASTAKLPLDEESRSFDEPWQAQVFALVVGLNEQGKFTWEDWVQMFSRHIKAAPALPGEGTNDTYYRQWMSSLEEMAASVCGISESILEDRVSEWRQAYLNTPHGEAVHLNHATCPPRQSSCGHHHTTANLEPIAVSAPISS